jgi:hypothetical protein
MADVLYCDVCKEQDTLTLLVEPAFVALVADPGYHGRQEMLGKRHPVVQRLNPQAWWTMQNACNLPTATQAGHNECIATTPARCSATRKTCGASETSGT